MSEFTRAEKKLKIAIGQFKGSESRTRKQINDLRIQFQKRENEINMRKITLVDNRVRSENYLEKIKSFLNDESIKNS